MENKEKIEDEDKTHADDATVHKLLKNVSDWSFDVFALSEASSNQPLMYLTLTLFKRYGIPYTFNVDPVVLQNFAIRIEEGYCRFENAYHHNLHAAEVTHTMHYMISKTGLNSWLTSLEIFACLLAALIHDYEHTGTMNSFHVATKSKKALIYNDRSVQENDSISAAFFLMRDANFNILSNLSRQQYRVLRHQVIDMVLSTDMALHFNIMKEMRTDIASDRSEVNKTKVLSLLLHSCDISNPAKHWSLHSRFATMIMDELFKQGDLERQMGLPVSPLCDRETALLPESQIHFIDFFTEPTLTLCAAVLEHVLEPIAGACKDANAALDEQDSEVFGGKRFRIRKPWVACMVENKKNWKIQTRKGIKWSIDTFHSCESQRL